MDNALKWIYAKSYYENLTKLRNLEEIIKQEEINASIYAYSPALEDKDLRLYISPEKARKFLEELKPELEKEIKETEEKLFEMLKDEYELPYLLKELQEIMQKPYEDDEYVFEMIDEVLNNDN